MLTWLAFIPPPRFLQLRKCGCPKGSAYRFEACVPCWPLFLWCPYGSDAYNAMPLPNYTRLKNEMQAFRCLEPADRCSAKYDESDAWLVARCCLYFCCSLRCFICLCQGQVFPPSAERQSSGQPVRFLQQRIQRYYVYGLRAKLFCPRKTL